jgi:hypothetical protein
LLYTCKKMKFLEDTALLYRHCIGILLKKIKKTLFLKKKCHKSI